ncbi:MAG TPA: IS30 family transposase [Ilumatobacteraceae bacterium]|nr:IS30 family transposase [Ilumatobacteraceae bacterium]
MRRLWLLPLETRQRIVRMAMEGYSHAEIIEATRVSAGSVVNVLRNAGGTLRRVERVSINGRLSLADRSEIYAGLAAKESGAAIARRLDVHPSTVTREIAGNGGRDGYRPLAAHRRALKLARRPQMPLLDTNPRLAAYVIERLEKLWSPEQIVRRLIEEFPDDAEMRVSHETIYQSLYVQGRGALRKELASCLRTGRAIRRRRDQRNGNGPGKIPGMVNISERPAEVEDRAVPGHWEGDLIIGAGGRSAIGTLVERTTRFVMLLHLPNGHSAAEVNAAMAAKIAELPAALVRSITWDQGTELARHRQFSIDTGVDIYFCDPHSPWQRGSNENTNGLLRQYFPKSTDLNTHDAAHLDTVADQLNGRPRKTLNWKTPAEALANLLDAIAA